MKATPELIAEYHELLRDCGLEKSSPEKDWEALRDSTPFPRTFFGELLENLMDGHKLNLSFDTSTVHTRQVILQELSEDVEDIVADICGREHLRTPILVAEFPTGDINASARKMRHGFLILLNHGLMSLFEKTILLFLGHGLRVKREGSNSSDKEAVGLLEFHLKKFQGVESSPPSYAADNPFPIDLPASIKFRYFKNICLKFAIAHEYSHIAAGHFESDVNVARTPNGFVEVLPKSWHEEFEADAVATKAILEDSRKPKSELGQYIDLFEIALAAPHFFFGISLLSALLASGIDDSQHGDHPPIERRREYATICIAEAEGVSKETLEFSFLCDHWIRFTVQSTTSPFSGQHE
jgi:hypothetical protein